MGNQDNVKGLIYDAEAKTITITNYTIENEEVVEFIKGYPEEKRNVIFGDILELGVKSLKSFLTENYGRLIERSFNKGISDLDGAISKKLADLEQQVLQKFIEDSRKKILDEFSKSFDERTESLIKDIEDKSSKLDKEILNSFLNTLRDVVFKSFTEDFSKLANDLKENLGKYIVEEEKIQETTEKGEEFENYIFQLSQIPAKYFGDDAKHVGPDNKTGDILIENPSEKLRFAIEVKDTKLTGPGITDTFSNMERDRNVKYSIIVFRNAQQVPEKIGSFHLYGMNRLVIALAESPEDNPNQFIFNVGYRLIRFLALHEKSEEKEVDVKVLASSIRSIRETLETFRSLKKKVTGFCNDLSQNLDELKNKIEEELGKMEGEIKK